MLLTKKQRLDAIKSGKSLKQAYDEIVENAYKEEMRAYQVEQQKIAEMRAKKLESLNKRIEDLKVSAHNIGITLILEVYDTTQSITLTPSSY